MKSRTSRLTGLTLLISFTLLSVCRGGELRAGLARVEITPTLPVVLAGYASRKDLSKGIHDPLSARVVAFAEGGQRLVLVSIDIRSFAAQGPVRTLLRDIELPAQPCGESTEAPGKSSIKLTVGRVGQVAFVGLGGEVFNEIGQVIKARSPFRHTFVLTHCNGASGYVPTASAYPEGGYEVRSSPFAAGAGERLADEAVQALKDLAATPWAPNSTFYNPTETSLTHLPLLS